MFHDCSGARWGARWAAAFIDVLGNGAESALVCLQALTVHLNTVSRILFGRAAARQLERMLRESIPTEKVLSDKTDIELEYVIRFICLLVEKKQFLHIDSIMALIEERLDTQKGILYVTVESAVSVDSEFENELKQMIMDRTGAKGIKMKICVVPELLAGYRLRFSGWYIDASLKKMMHTMAAELTAKAKTSLPDMPTQESMEYK